MTALSSSSLLSWTIGAKRAFNQYLYAKCGAKRSAGSSNQTLKDCLLIWVQADTCLFILTHRDMKKWWMSELRETPSCRPGALSLPAALPFLSGFFLHNLTMKPARVREWAAPPPHIPCKVVDKQQMEGAQKKTILPGEKGCGTRNKEIPLAFTKTTCFHLFLIQANPMLKRPHHKNTTPISLYAFALCLCPFPAVPDLSPSLWWHIYEGHWSTQFNPWKTYNAVVPNHN